MARIPRTPIVESPRARPIIPIVKEAPPWPGASPGTAVADWQQDMAQEALVDTGRLQHKAGGAFLSLRGGQLSLNDNVFPNNQLPVIVLDHIFENAFYPDAYEPGVVSPPKCFAFGRDEATMRPHDVVFEHEQEENDRCPTCPRNEFGSAETGRGKACGNRARLSILAAAASIDALGHDFKPFSFAEFENTPVVLLKLPVMSVKGWANYVTKIANVYKRPPAGVFSLLKVVPDQRSQIRVQFDLLSEVPGELWPIIKRRRAESQSMLEAPYNLDAEENTEAAEAQPKGIKTLRAAAARGARSVSPNVPPAAVRRKFT